MTRLRFDRVADMCNGQLELAWAGSIYEEPERCRLVGLKGLDRTMFKNPTFFEIGHQMLRNLKYKNSADFLYDEELVRFFEPNGFLSLVEEASLVGLFIPAFFFRYAEEIERRASKVFEL